MTLKGIVLPGEKPILNYGKEVMGVLREKVVDVCVCVCVCVCVRAHTYFQNAEKGVKLVLPRKVLKCSSQWTLMSPTRKTYFIDSCDSFKEVAQLNTLQ